VWSPLVVVLLLWVVPLPDFGRLQYNDYYELLPQLSDDEGHYSKNPLTYITLRSNEHRVAFPAMIYVLNAKLTAGDNRGLSVVSLIFLAIAFTLLYRWTPPAWRRDPATRFLIVAVLSVFAMTPVAAHNVVKGFSGTIWLFANAVSLSAMTILATADRVRPWPRLAAVIGLGIFGALTYSTTMSLWPALVVGSLLLGLGGKRAAVIAGAGIAVIATYTAFVQTPEHHPGADASQPVELVKYLGIYFGGIFSDRPRIAMLFGLVGLVLFAAAVVRTLRSDAEFRRSAAPWIMIGLYGFGNGLGTSITRAGFGLEQALASRYATLASFVWLCTLAVAVLAALRASTASDRRRRVIAVASLAIVLTLISAAHGVQKLRLFVIAAHNQPMAELAMKYGIWDHDILSAITPDPGGPIRAIPFLRANRHIPFEKPHVAYHGRPLPDSGAAASSNDGVAGAFDALIRLNTFTTRITGWAYSPGREIRRILAIDADGIVRGEAVTGVVREDVAAIHGPEARTSGWVGWVLVETPEDELRVHVQFVGDELFYPVGRSFRVAEAPSPGN
jgi:hypothetical protein